jgi:NADH dehydrogenase [ubiquinone] 1 alpha subcomplex assembly factor 7
VSALGDEIKGMLAKGGALTIERFMQLALADPQYGYYMTRDPFGIAGDFTTAIPIRPVPDMAIIRTALYQ